LLTIAPFVEDDWRVTDCRGVSWSTEGRNDQRDHQRHDRDD
jgi:hypothetical protein